MVSARSTRLRHAPAQVVQQVDAGDKAEETLAVHHDHHAPAFEDGQQVFDR